MSGVEKAIERAGGVGALAEKLNITRQAIERWIANGKVPAGWVFAVFDETAVPLHELNSEIYPADRVRIKA